MNHALQLKKQKNSTTTASKLVSINHANSVKTVIQPKLKIGAPNDKYEQEADRVADQVMRMPTPVQSSSVNSSPTSNINHIQRKCVGCAKEEELIQKKSSGATPEVTPSINSSIQSLQGKGQPLNKSERNFFEPRFGTDLSHVRLHTDSHAARTARSINAKAYTHGNNVVFGAGEYSASSAGGRKLLAHELTHVTQQQQKPLSIQRTIEFRPPGRGEASAFNRVNEIIDRLNQLSSNVLYSLEENGRTLSYSLLPQNNVNNFDQQMMRFIDLEQTIPLRLINSTGSINGLPIVGDSFLSGYVDLDDLMSSDDFAFQSILIHILEERAVTPRFDQRIGTPSLNPNTPGGNRAFRRGHQAGHRAQAEHFKDVFNDPSIIFNFEELFNSGRAIIAFKSTVNNYRVIINLPRITTSSTGRSPILSTSAHVIVRFRDQTFTVEDFLNSGPLSATLKRGTNQSNFNFSGIGLGIPSLTLRPLPTNLLGLSPNLLPQPLSNQNFSNNLNPGNQTGSPRVNQCLRNPSFPDFSCLIQAYKQDIDQNLLNNAHQFSRVATLFPNDTDMMWRTFMRYGLGLNLLETSFQFLGTRQDLIRPLSIGTGAGIKLLGLIQNNRLELDLSHQLNQNTMLDFRLDLNTRPFNIPNISVGFRRIF